MNTAVRKAIELANVCCAKNCPSIEDWNAIEKESEILLPDDYKLFISAVGQGQFGDLNLLNPCKKSDSFCKESSTLLRWCDKLKPIAEHVNICLHPSLNGFIPIGIISSDGILYIKSVVQGDDVYEIIFMDTGVFKKYAYKSYLCQFLMDVFFKNPELPQSSELREILWEPVMNSGLEFFTPS